MFFGGSLTSEVDDAFMVLCEGLPKSYLPATENAVISNKTTGVFAPVATRTDARSPLASTVEPRTVPKNAYQHH